MKNMDTIGKRVIDALKVHNCRINGMNEVSNTQFRFRYTFATRGGNVHQQVRLYPNKIQFEDLYDFDNNVFAGGHNTLPLEFMPIYNAILSIYVNEIGRLPEVDFILH